MTTTGLPALDNSNFDPSRCVVQDLPASITSSWYTKRKPIGMVIENVLTPEECQMWIDHSENAGYGEALINVGGGKQMKMLDTRNSARCIIDDQERAAELWARIRTLVPSIVIEKRLPYELNERLRFLRYDVGEFFAPHLDGRYDRLVSHPREGDYSIVTFQLYLNDDFEGGTTRFFHSTADEEYDVVPKTGSVLLFEHRMEHSGEKVTAGRKYAMRTDIMYAKVNPNEEDNVVKQGTDSDDCIIS